MALCLRSTAFCLGPNCGAQVGLGARGAILAAREGSRLDPIMSAVTRLPDERVPEHEDRSLCTAHPQALWFSAWLAP